MGGYSDFYVPLLRSLISAYRFRVIPSGARSLYVAVHGDGIIGGGGGGGQESLAYQEGQLYASSGAFTRMAGL